MFFIGLMSGTSADGIDAVLLSFDPNSHPTITATGHTPYPEQTLRDLVILSESPEGEYPELPELDRELGDLFADAVNRLLTETGINSDEVTAIGSHGHTVRHAPDAEKPFSLQIGDASIIARRTSITTVADFRSSDIAVGGQGAPLVPAFHRSVFHSPDLNRVILNIGGIANITYLPVDAAAPVLGFDTGPGNTLLDHWIKQQRNLDFDEDGDWAASGNSDGSLLELLLSDPYFFRPPPKSTGKEYFNLAWLSERSNREHMNIAPEDVQATLAALTASSIARSIKKFLPTTDEIYICGGGCHNRHLVTLIEKSCEPVPVSDTSALGIDPDWVEAAAFAWLAKQTLEGKPGNLPSVTGARSAVPLGQIFMP
jgi:anhydro-N-acetylmuramic acid kinase